DKLTLLTEKIMEKNLTGHLYPLKIDNKGLQVEESVF
ncbi:MAG: homoserine kinase, partial [Lactococcus lactis]|nr:homoserine kinase [Lactococcus lactis]